MKHWLILNGLQLVSRTYMGVGRGSRGRRGSGDRKGSGSMKGSGG